MAMCMQFIFAFTSCFSATTAYAEFDFIPYIASQTEYNSNVFDVTNTQQAIVENADAKRSDRLQKYLVGTDALYQYGQQKLRGSVEGRRHDYSHFSRLDHNEYLLDGALDWLANDGLGGDVTFRQERRMTSFADRNTSELTLERDRLAGTRVKLMLTPDWVLQGGLRNHQLDSPIAGAPDFALIENAANASAGYLGLGAINAGIELEYLRGEYRGIPGSSKFDQTTLELISSYDVSGITRIDVKLGYTQRKDQGGNASGESGYTGTLRMSRRLSEITAVRIQMFRRISSYTAGTATVSDTGASADINWQPTIKIMVNGEYSLINSDFQGQGAAGSADNGRRDRNQEATLKINYQTLDWLLIKPYASYLRRGSSIGLDNFKAGIFGIEVRISLGLPFPVTVNEERSPIADDSVAEPRPALTGRFDANTDQ